MSQQAKAMLVWMLDCPSEIEDEWNEWYDLEHFANLVRVPGFLNGQRYVRLRDEAAQQRSPVDPVPKYLTVYELADRSVLESPAYFVNRTSTGPGMRPHWNRRMASQVVRVIGGPYFLRNGPGVVDAGRASDFIWVTGFDPAGPGHDGLDSWLDDAYLPSLRSCDGVLAIQSLGAFADAPPVSSTNSRRGWSRMFMCAVSGRSVAERAERQLAPILAAGAHVCSNVSSVAYEKWKR